MRLGVGLEQRGRCRLRNGPGSDFEAKEGSLIVKAVVVVGWGVVEEEVAGGEAD